MCTFSVNCENASYGATICAERNAITTALAQGYRKFKAIAVATELKEPGSPCGICRQFLIEFGNYKVILGSSTSANVVYTTTAELLPHAFTPASLDNHAHETLGKNTLQ
ncbi:putative cytidine deaminase [Ancylostoma duodenale]|uniref:Putative cytidine deaminase n=1 Tax=Ancylostoma duodenale TaxID=51022 RepID=A0A0C2FVA9_9BILA|nr:putative cytidine deaminase [Ancylostoma duodenale]